MWVSSSAQSRLFPTPGSPTTVTSWQERCCAARSNVPISSVFSSSRPTSGVVAPGHVGAEAGPRSQGPPERKRLRLALDRDGLQPLPLEHALRGPVRLLGDRHPVHRSGPLQPRGRVHDVAGHQPFAVLRPRLQRHHRLACVDSHPHLQRERRLGCVQLLDRLQHAEAGPHGPLRVVLVRHRRAEHRHHRVSDELLDRAAEPLELLPQPPRGTAGSAPARPRDRRPPTRP